MWRTIGMVGFALMLTAAPVVAEHSPHFDVTCPTGSADIVLDPGHGGDDPGAVNESHNLFERDLNLEIALMTAEILENEFGYRVALTRKDNETALGNSERGEIANACNALVFIEIHLNSSTDTQVNYSQTFWGEKEKDLLLTMVIGEALQPLGIPMGTVERFDNGGLLRAKMPSVLVEAVFMSHPGEAGNLANGTRQVEVAESLSAAIDGWMKMQG